MTRALRSVRARMRLPESTLGPGFTSFGLRGSPDFPLDPFLNVDDFRMSVPTFPPHPHAGFSAVTYLFEDSAGALRNRDSLGDGSRIGPGDLHWTQAGRGMMHEERPETEGTVCHGVQMFVNLRSEHKHAPPRAFHVDAKDIPEVKLGQGARLRLLAGSVLGAESPLTALLTPVLLLDVHLAPGARAQIPVDAPTCFVLSLAGAGSVGPTAGTAPLEAHEAIAFADDGRGVELAAGPRGLHLLLAGGTPLAEPVVFGGPFAMTTRADIDAAIARYQAGEMGRLEPSS